MWKEAGLGIRKEGLIQELQYSNVFSLADYITFRYSRDLYPHIRLPV